MADALSFTIGASFSASGFTAASSAVKQLGADAQAAGTASVAAAKATEDAYARATEKVQAAVEKLKEAQGAPAPKATGAFEGGVSQGAGVGVGLALIEGAKEAIGLLQGAVAEGIRFNATVESSQLGVAAILRQFDPIKFTSVGGAMAAAGDVIEDLKAKATETTASFTDLVQAFTANAGAATAAGVPIEKQADLLVTLSNAVAGLGLENRQLGQETRALLTGMIDENAVVARTLGITREQIEAAKAQGNVYGFLTGKLAAFKEAGELAAGTLSGLQSNLGDFREQLEGELTAPLFDVEKTGLRDLSERLKDPAVAESARILGQSLADAADAARVLGANAVPVLAALVSGSVAAVNPLAALTAEINRATEAQERYGRAYANGNKDLQRQIQLANNDVSQNAVRLRVANEILQTEERLSKLRSANDRLFQGDNIAAAEQQLTRLKGIESTLDRTLGKQVNIKTQVQLTKEAVEKEKVARDAVATSLEKSLADARELILADEKRIATLNEQLNAGRPLSEQQTIATAAAEKQLAALRSMAGAVGLQVGPLATVAQIQDGIAKLPEALQPKLLEQLRIYNETLIKAQKITGEIGNQVTAADALAKRLKAASDALPVDGSQATADARVPLTTALSRVPAVNTAAASGAFPAETVNVMATLISALANFGAKPAILPSPAPAPLGPVDYSTTGYGDSGSRVASPAEQDSGAAAAKAAGEAVKAGGDAVKTALDTTLTPAAASLTAAATALPGQLAPIADGLAELLSTQGEHFDTLADLVQTSATANANTARKLQQLADYVYANV